MEGEGGVESSGLEDAFGGGSGAEGSGSLRWPSAALIASVIMSIICSVGDEDSAGSDVSGVTSGVCSSEVAGVSVEVLVLLCEVDVWLIIITPPPTFTVSTTGVGSGSASPPTVKDRETSEKAVLINKILKNDDATRKVVMTAIALIIAVIFFTL